MTYHNHIDLSLQLRTAADSERDELIRFKLREVAMELAAATLEFQMGVTGHSMTRLNCSWANAVRTLDKAGQSVHLVR